MKKKIFCCFLTLIISFSLFSVSSSAYQMSEEQEQIFIDQIQKIKESENTEDLEKTVKEYYQLSMDHFADSVINNGFFVDYDISITDISEQSEQYNYHTEIIIRENYLLEMLLTNIYPRYKYESIINTIVKNITGKYDEYYVYVENEHKILYLIVNTETIPELTDILGIPELVSFEKSTEDEDFYVFSLNKDVEKFVKEHPDPKSILYSWSIAEVTLKSPYITSANSEPQKFKDEAGYSCYLWNVSEDINSPFIFSLNKKTFFQKHIVTYIILTALLVIVIAFVIIKICKKAARR